MAARQKEYIFYISTSVNDTGEVTISLLTNFQRSQERWTDGEFYFYGTLKNAGGKNKANIHLDTPDYGYLTIHTDKKFLGEQRENLLYKRYGIRVRGKQNLDTGEIDTASLERGL